MNFAGVTGVSSEMASCSTSTSIPDFTNNELQVDAREQSTFGVVTSCINFEEEVVEKEQGE